MLDTLDCLREGCETFPALGCAASQRVKLAPRIFEHRGVDGGKHVNGRKGQLLTDSGGRSWSAHVHAAHQHDSRGAVGLHRPWWAARLRTILTDAAYRALFADHLRPLRLRHEVVSCPPLLKASCPWPSARSSGVPFPGWPVFAA
ncbi:transposase [Hymenobacter psychrophilus]|uniref:transposase n=1 Tax=Hymenobacter psychrophilus TaxID=651662 RepID=UPI00373FCBA6